MLFFLFFISQLHAQQLDIVVGGKTQSYSLQELRQKLPLAHVTNLDPVYKKKKTFLGFPLKRIIEMVGPIATDLDELSFTAKDGYSPSFALKEALMENGVIAFNLEPAIQNGKKLDLNPFYLVWERDEKVPEHFPRPYQLVKIEIMKFSDKFKELFPKEISDDDAAKGGFKIFRDYCFRCHSVNGIGGTLGPELNSPNNALEYWHKDKLKSFIKNPSAFRANSKMPMVPDLKDKDIDLILKYLDVMKSHKNAPKNAK